MTKRRLIIHTAIYLVIFGTAFPYIKNGLTSIPLWIAVGLAVLMLIMDIVRLVRNGIIED